MPVSDMQGPGISLTDAIMATAGRVPRKATRRTDSAAMPSATPSPSMTQSVKKVAAKPRHQPATRTGRKGFVLYFDPPVASAIRRLASEYDATNQDLGEWAFRLLFEKFGEAWPA
jgi:hypothetical protein